MSERPCIFGEVLFDHFPDGRRVLGGAPFNVAWHLQAFGEAPLLVSRIGDDPDGEAVAGAMSDWGLDRAGLQIDPRLPTGRVEVSIEDGEPHYEIVHPSAWDAIEPGEPGSRRSLLYHGTLALRDERSREAWRKLRQVGSSTVFVDVNLRPPWWRTESVLQAVEGANWVKLNRHELDELAPRDAPAGRRPRAFLERHGLAGLVLTDGAHGASILTADGERCNARPDANVPLVDTVGAGDALASVVILGLLRGWPMGATLERAQSFASAIVGRRGATVHERDFYSNFLQRWSIGAGQLFR